MFVAQIGPRQMGKTTLANTLTESIPAIYLDLEAAEDRAKLTDPALFLDNYEDRLVVLAEIHRVPEIFPALRGIIDRGRRRGHKTSRFLILGSASLDLLRQSSESLAGRIAYVEMGPLNVLETASMNESTNDHSTNPLWLRAGFPTVIWHPATTTALSGAKTSFAAISNAMFRCSALRMRQRR